MRATVILAALLLAACTSTGRYTGDEYYYSEGGVFWSCREPAPFRGGNCRPEATWPDGGVGKGPLK